MSVLTAAVVQLCSTADVAHNLERVTALCQRAQVRGAELIVLPENFALLSPDENDKFAWAVRMVQSDAGLTGEGQILDRMRELARTLGAVSYTHLDVYKRQHRGRAALRFATLRKQTTDYADFTDLKRNHPQIGQIGQI